MPTPYRSSGHIVLAVLLDRDEPVTRPEIAAASGLSRPTVFAAVQDLEGKGLVREVGLRSGSPGRSASLYEVSSDIGLLGAVDIGGSNVRVAITDLRGRPVFETHEPTARPAGDTIVRQSIDLLRSALDAAGTAGTPLFKVAVSVPGVVAPDGRTVHYASNIDLYKPLDFWTPFGDAFDAPIILDNNVNLAAMGERWQGAARGLSTFVVVAVGAGVGAGVVHDGRVVRGAHGAAGEVAFLPPFGRQQKRDPHAHDAAGGLNLLEAARNRDDWTRPAPTTVEELFLRATVGEEPAAALVEDECGRIAAVIASICAVIDPESVILTGGMGANDHLIRRAGELAADMTPFPTRLIRSELGERASLVGAMYFAARSARSDVMDRLSLTESAPGKNR